MANPACAMMADGCPRTDCRFQAENAWVEAATAEAPAASCYAYRCLTCDGRWTVKWPQVQPVFDREGKVASFAAPAVLQN